MPRTGYTAIFNLDCRIKEQHITLLRAIACALRAKTQDSKIGEDSIASTRIRFSKAYLLTAHARHANAATATEGEG